MFESMHHAEDSAMISPTTVECVSKFSRLLRAINSCRGYEPIFHSVVEIAARTVGCRTCALIIIDPKTEYLQIEMSYGLSYTFEKQFRKKIATGSIGGMLWLESQIVINDAATEPEHAAEVALEHPFASCACLPIIADARSLGYLFADSDKAGFFNEESLTLLEALAEVAGVAYNKARMIEDQIRLAVVDAESGLLRYERFLNRASAHISDAVNTAQPFAVLICDIDNFKESMLTYGYEASRKLIAEIGSLIGGSVRAADICGRYGPDEFIILMPDTNDAAASEFAVSLCGAVASRMFTERSFTSSVSIGISVYPQNGSSLDALITAARKATFEAQRKGRNTVVRAGF